MLLTTHAMDEAQRLVDRVAVIVAGRSWLRGPPDAIAGPGRSTAMVVYRLPAGMGVDELPLPVASFDERDRLVTLETDAPTCDTARLAAWAARRGVELPGLTVTRPSLEEAYLRLTNEQEARPLRRPRRACRAATSLPPRRATRRPWSRPGPG